MKMMIINYNINYQGKKIHWNKLNKNKKLKVINYEYNYI